jgi:hypothetical protein
LIFHTANAGKILPATMDSFVRSAYVAPKNSVCRAHLLPKNGLSVK